MKKQVFFVGLVFFVFVVSMAAQAAPIRITNLSAAAVTNTKIALSWLAPVPSPTSCPLVEYDIRYGTSPVNTLNWASRTQVSGEPIPGVAGASQSMTVEGLSPNTTYYFAVKTKDSCGVWSILSNLAITTTLDMAKTATLCWDAPTTNTDGTPLTDLAGYKIYYGTSSGDYTEVIDVGNVTTHTISDLSWDYVYYFVATAYDASGNESGYSNEVSK